MSATCETLPFRVDGRRPDQLRPIRFINHFAPHATGSTLVEWGNTRVICAVTVEEAVPKWMQAQKVAGGWVTAEYSMLPYSTLERKQRDISKMKIDGRSQEIQRGAFARALVHLSELNLSPAVLPGNAGTHPHVYDRLLAAGVTPEFPRPAVPERLSWHGYIPKCVFVVLLFVALVKAADHS